jgi:hypothetical protein
MRLTVLLFPVLFATACGTHAGPAQSTPPANATDTLARIRAMTATPRCTQDSQCHSLALGVNPCGGAEGYLAWSSERTSPGEIRALGDIYQAERRAANQKSGRIGQCRFLPDPGAVCQAGLCQLASPPALR